MYRSKVFKHALQTQNTIGTQTITGASILTNLISKQPRFFLAHFPTEETLCELSYNTISSPARQRHIRVQDPVETKKEKEGRQ